MTQNTSTLPLDTHKDKHHIFISLINLRLMRKDVKAPFACFCEHNPKLLTGCFSRLLFSDSNASVVGHHKKTAKQRLHAETL